MSLHDYAKSIRDQRVGGAHRTWIEDPTCDAVLQHIEAQVLERTPTDLRPLIRTKLTAKDRDVLGSLTLNVNADKTRGPYCAWVNFEEGPALRAWSPNGNDLQFNEWLNMAAEPLSSGDAELTSAMMAIRQKEMRVDLSQPDSVERIIIFLMSALRIDKGYAG